MRIPRQRRTLEYAYRISERLCRTAVHKFVGVGAGSAVSRKKGKHHRHTTSGRRVVRSRAARNSTGIVAGRQV